MNQVVTVAKIAGDASKVVVRAFQRWSEARVRDPEEATLVESDQWPAGCRAEIEQFTRDLRANAEGPPVVFWNEHRDLWSMGDIFQNGFPENGNPLYEVESDSATSLLCYAMPDGNALHAHLGRELRRKHFAEETKWYLRVLREALSAYGSLAGEAAIVVMRQVVGGLVTDDEITDACLSTPNWLLGFKT